MATWNERIDNLQARLANLVSEEFAGANFYNTNIAVSDYNPSIDSTVTVTITVTNAEGDPVEDASVPVTASEGQFTKLNNTTITAASSVTGTTNSSGQFTLTYSCTEWGLITFSANNNSTQILVKGWKQIWSAESGKIAAYRNNNHARLILDGLVRSSVPTSYGQYGSSTPLSSIAPVKSTFDLINGSEIIIKIGADGAIFLKSNTGAAQSNVTVHGQVEWGI